MPHVKIKIKRTHGFAVIPKKAHPNDGGYDLYTTEDILVKDGREKAFRMVVPLGFSMALPRQSLISRLFTARWHYVAKVLPRSGFTSKGMEVTLAFPQYDHKGELCTDVYRQDADVEIGLIDEPYRGICGVLLVNRGDKCFIPKGTRIAQMTIERVYDADFIEVGELDETDRDGGFGHSGTR